MAVLRHLEGFFEKSEESRHPLKLKNTFYNFFLGCLFQKIWWSRGVFPSQKFSKLFFLFQDKKLFSKIYIIFWRIFQNLTGLLKALCNTLFTLMFLHKTGLLPISNLHTYNGRHNCCCLGYQCSLCRLDSNHYGGHCMHQTRPKV